MGAQFLSHYLTILDIEIIFSIVSNHTKILNLTSDPITFAKRFLSKGPARVYIDRFKNTCNSTVMAVCIVRLYYMYYQI